jgi:iron complex transport system ATP-binding protein
MLLDEPVAHLDAPHQRLLAQVLRREASLGRSVISVLHELPLALQADELAIMQDGQILMQGSRDDPAVHRALESVFDHAVAITRVDDRWVVLPQF